MKTLLSLIFLFLFVKTSFSQLPVREEPRHKTVFENNRVRILDVHIKPGDTSLFHRHATASVIVMLTNTKLGTQVKGGEPVISQTEAGSTSYADWGKNPVFHHVWNDDTDIFHVMDIELLGKEKNDSSAAGIGPAFHALWQEKLANAYSIALSKNETVTTKTASHPILLINISGRSVVHSGTQLGKSLTGAGQFVWIEAGNIVELDGDPEAGSKLVALELK